MGKEGCKSPRRLTEVELDVQDTGDNLHEALQTTLEKRPDVLFGPYGSGPMLTVARSCTRLIWNHGGASSRLARPSFPPGDQCALAGFDLFRRRSSERSIPLTQRPELFRSFIARRDLVGCSNRCEDRSARLQMTIQAAPFEPSRVLEIIHRFQMEIFCSSLGTLPMNVSRSSITISKLAIYRICRSRGGEVLASLGELRGRSHWTCTMGGAYLAQA